MHDESETNVEPCSPHSCNVCFKKLNCFRMKCLQCIDYDMCMECMLAGALSDSHDPDTHVLMKISVTDAPSENLLETDPVRQMVQRLSVLDAFHYFQQNTDALAQYVHLQSSVVKEILDG